MNFHRPGAPRTLADEALLRIRADIIAGRLAAGEKLQPDLLEQRYALGRSPIREALSRLATIGLVHGEGQRGFMVPALTEAELMDIADLRCRLSTEALERSMREGGDEWESAVVASFHRLTLAEGKLPARTDESADEWEQRNRDFHRALEAACGSPWLQQFCDLLYDQSERYRRAFVRYPEINPAIHAQHRAIMEAALRRDAVAAKALLAQHIMQGAHATRRLLLGIGPK
ncbi:GntR family transcriptional regulator [Roseococcus sp. YIM B11640]|uniref:GntR family transcriptional regulator n=1 Tax=Roseococcus sp. YIM B11640 TaxID=3133973 RepID=UPI003C7CECE6